MWELQNGRTTGRPTQYDLVAGPGHLALLQFTPFSAGNPARLGNVVASAEMSSLVQCINADAATLNTPTGVLNPSVNTARAINCILSKGSQGSLSFYYMNPPVPFILDQLVDGFGYTVNPDVVLTPGAYGPPPGTLASVWDFQWTVFVRDKRNNRYYRDSYGSLLTKPDYPANPCDGQIFIDEERGLIYEYEGGSFCRWYLLALTPEAEEVGKDVLPDTNVLSLPIDVDTCRTCPCNGGRKSSCCCANSSCDDGSSEEEGDCTKALARSTARSARHAEKSAQRSIRSAKIVTKSIAKKEEGEQGAEEQKAKSIPVAQQKQQQPKSRAVPVQQRQAAQQKGRAVPPQQQQARGRAVPPHQKGRVLLAHKPRSPAQLLAAKREGEKRAAASTPLSAVVASINAARVAQSKRTTNATSAAFAAKQRSATRYRPSRAVNPVVRPRTFAKQ